MYPESLLWWIGGTALVLGMLGIMGMFAWWLDHRFQKHIERRHDAPRSDEEGRSALWIVFEVFSAILVVTSLLVAIYSSSALLRGVAGVALIIVVSAATTALMAPED